MTFIVIEVQYSFTSKIITKYLTNGHKQTCPNIEYFRKYKCKSVALILSVALPLDWYDKASSVDPDQTASKRESGLLFNYSTIDRVVFLQTMRGSYVHE